MVQLSPQRAWRGSAATRHGRKERRDCREGEGARFGNGRDSWLRTGAKFSLPSAGNRRIVPLHEEKIVAIDVAIFVQIGFGADDEHARASDVSPRMKQ